MVVGFCLLLASNPYKIFELQFFEQVLETIEYNNKLISFRDDSSLIM